MSPIKRPSTPERFNSITQKQHTRWNSSPIVRPRNNTIQCSSPHRAQVRPQRVHRGSNALNSPAALRRLFTVNLRSAGAPRPQRRRRQPPAAKGDRAHVGEARVKWWCPSAARGRHHHHLTRDRRVLGGGGTQQRARAKRAPIMSGASEASDKGTSASAASSFKSPSSHHSVFETAPSTRHRPSEPSISANEGRTTQGQDLSKRGLQHVRADQFALCCRESTPRGLVRL